MHRDRSEDMPLRAIKQGNSPTRYRRMKMNMRMRFAIALAAMGLTTAVARAEQVMYQDGFEYADSPANHGWEITNANGDPGGTAATSTDVAFDGSRSVRLESHTRLSHSLSEMPATGVHRITVHFYDSMLGGLNWDATASVSFDNYSARVGIGWYNPSTYIWYPPYGSWQGTSVPRSQGWHRFEWVVDNGQVDASIDGTVIGADVLQVASISGIAFDTGTESGIYAVFDAVSAVAQGEPSNTKILFSSDRTGNYDIWCMDPNGGNLQQLTNNPAMDRYPSSSPDGSRIAFVSDRDGDDEIFVMNADGSSQSVLTANTVADGPPDWSPDGTKIAFHSYLASPNYLDVFVMDADGGNLTNLTSDSPRDDVSPAWSPDGSRIAFDSARAGNRQEIYVMDANGANIVRLTDNSVEDTNPTWSPDGSKIAFSVGIPGGYYSIYTMDAADGQNRQEITSLAGDEVRPSWSPDGTKIAFFTDRDSQNDIWTVNANGTGSPDNLTNSPGVADKDPSWSPVLQPTNSAPVADAGPDQIVECASASGTEVVLDGSGSSDPDGNPLTYSWLVDGVEIATGVGPSVTLGLGTHTITLIVSDGLLESQADEVVVSIVDTQPPQITVLGDNPVALECHVPYEDAGATAIDVCDGQVSVQTAGEVDVSKLGDYTITYTASDGSGNVATASRTVVVADTSPPTIAAALERMRGNGSRPGDDDDGDDGDDDEEGDEGGRNGGNRYLVVLSATDACDAIPAVFGFISQPLNAGDNVQLRFTRKRGSNSIRIQMHRRAVRVTLTGPDRGVLETLWEQAVADGGFPVENGQVVKLADIGGRDNDDDDEDGGAIRYELDAGLVLTAAFVPSPTLVAWSRDASGNTSETVRIGLPLRGRGAGKVVAAGVGLDGGLRNYPNPFNSGTVIAYSVREFGPVSVELYNLAGQRVRLLEASLKAPGYYEVGWDGKDESGMPVSAGIYLCHLRAGGATETRRMLLMK